MLNLFYFILTICIFTTFLILRTIPQAVLPQHEKSAYTYLLRRHEIEQRRLQYKWNSNTVTNGNMNSKTDESSSSDGESEEGLNMSNLLPGRMKVKGYDNLPKEAKFNVQVYITLIYRKLHYLVSFQFLNTIYLY